MIVISSFDKCPICSRADRDNQWIAVNHNELWWERMCSEYHNFDCGFSQFYWTSYEDTYLKYLKFSLKNFYAYTYTTDYAKEAKNLGIFAGTRFYHKVFPKNTNAQGSFQDWPDYIPDWNKLDKLNNKLKLLSVFS